MQRLAIRGGKSRIRLWKGGFKDVGEPFVACRSKGSWVLKKVLWDFAFRIGFRSVNGR